MLESSKQCPEAKIVAVIVSYNSLPDILIPRLATLQCVSEVIVCDNSTQSDISEELQTLCKSSDIRYFGMQGNKGIAYAQNFGIKKAMEMGAEFVLLLDDDSCFLPDIATKLHSGYRELVGLGHKVAAIGATAISDNGDNISNKISDERFCVCDYMMSSGALININLFPIVGFMENDLFIDCVDFDWGWRAIDKGYSLFLFKDVQMRHRLGNGEITLLGVKVKVPSPIRHYYQYRNILIMFARPYVPVVWKFKQFYILSCKFFLLPLFADQGLTRLRYMIKGIYHGLF